MLIIIGYTLQEGGLIHHTVVKLDTLTSLLETGNLRGQQLAAIFFPDGLVYDYVLEARGVNPFRGYEP